jgi:endonuclease III
MRRLKIILDVLDREVPDPKVELKYSDPLELLVATILSARCTDERVNRVTAGLFRKYRKVLDYAEADPETLAEEIRSTGFFRNKARNIIRCCRELVDRFGGIIPDRMEDLVSLPGVWRKTASVILGNCFGTPAIVVDTHVLRVSQRLGLTASEDPDQVEQDLGGLLPMKTWTRRSHQMILFGRRICTARAPLCSSCGMRPICSYYLTQESGKATGGGIIRKRGRPKAS